MAILHPAQQKLNKIITISTFCSRKVESAKRSRTGKSDRERSNKVKARSDRFEDFGVYSENTILKHSFTCFHPLLINHNFQSELCV